MRGMFVSILVAGAIAFGAPRSADAGSAVGTWQSSSGTRFVIPDSRTDFDLIATHPDGHQDVYKGRWVNGMVGTQFVYGGCTATINRMDQEVIRVVCRDGQQTMWTRVAIQHGRPGGIVGTWHSTSGFHFAIPRFSPNVFDILMTAPNGQKTLMKGQWVSGLVGTQFIMGKYTCTFNADDPDMIRVVASDEKFIWQRD